MDPDFFGFSVDLEQPSNKTRITTDWSTIRKDIGNRLRQSVSSSKSNL